MYDILTHALEYIGDEYIGDRARITSSLFLELSRSRMSYIRMLYMILLHILFLFCSRLFPHSLEAIVLDCQTTGTPYHSHNSRKALPEDLDDLLHLLPSSSVAIAILAAHLYQPL